MISSVVGPLILVVCLGFMFFTMRRALICQRAYGLDDRAPSLLTAATGC